MHALPMQTSINIERTDLVAEGTFLQRSRCSSSTYHVDHPNSSIHENCIDPRTAFVASVSRFRMLASNVFRPAYEPFEPGNSHSCIIDRYKKQMV